ncbi:hypothetical protein NDK47_11480 [Brevibacillus ruminantium]|uniref:Uncharacterized protein n=1 Tax=Brevibacillus ruminantium TaxID=2950604 RepID=A0ABY4WLW5_9BACL|nr:hypothetical protein [Brevibacillus ruminantium]USG67854.1 hypothetical protein NDK47_11480 [Brevibacillus ruminantium]
MKRKITVIIVFIIAVSGIFFAIDRMKYTSFEEIILSKIGKDDAVTIHIERYSDNKRLSIKDAALVEKILTDFSRMELKKSNHTKQSGSYAIRIYSNKSSMFGVEILQNKNFIWITLDNESNVYQIVNDFDPLKIIENVNFN